MRIRQSILLALVFAGFAACLHAPKDAPDSKELTALLNNFLAGASRNDAAVHDRFWADDLIYTRSAGKRVGKAEIMANVKPQPNEPETTYSAEDIRIQQYGTTAIVAFRLCRQNEEGKRHAGRQLP